MTTFNIPRDLLLTSNQRHHWTKRSRATKTLRAMGYHITKQARLKPMQRARLIVTVAWPNRRRRDVSNLAPTIKALVDGSVDAGILIDDNDKYLVGPDLRVAETLCGKQFAATLTFDWQALADGESAA